MDQLKAMRVFVRVIDEGSFAGAARALDLAPAVVTRLVADLEEQIGARLINRTTRSLALTEVGANYLERVRQIVNDIDEANAYAFTATEELRGTLRVAGPGPLLMPGVVRLLPEFRRRYPKVELDISVVPPLEAPDENADVTLLVQGLREINGDFVARLLAHSEVVLCATPDYLSARGRPTTPADLAVQDVLVPELPLAPSEWTFCRRDTEGRTAEVVTLAPKRSMLSSDNPALLTSAATCGMGIAATLSLTVADALREGTLERVLPEWHVATYKVYVALPSRKHLPKRTRVFTDFLIEKFGGEPIDPWLAAIGQS
ncbi:LysR family transcriptional regulator [Aquabacterium sp. A7-Y]|uniref:LysR family transcriptional regulator n=1 Tax=Aquabacterium sp. A7-Y TaxID=1349605 RepID=UPI00223E2A99|nr:LysR family transcriptional regulator [Aquabacterium sp. A7-Y]MCW7540209.1 LysR family transcriptional regulator [Aquabacterium sp. A7-Y]